MASVNNIALYQVQGAVGKELVLRIRKGKTFISKYPDMSKVKPSSKQLKEKGRFAKAVKYAQGIIRDPVKNAAYKGKVKRGKTVYHTAIKEYLNTHK